MQRRSCHVLAARPLASLGSRRNCLFSGLSFDLSSATYPIRVKDWRVPRPSDEFPRLQAKSPGVSRRSVRPLGFRTEQLAVGLLTKQKVLRGPDRVARQAAFAAT